MLRKMPTLISIDGPPGLYGQQPTARAARWQVQASTEAIWISAPAWLQLLPMIGSTWSPLGWQQCGENRSNVLPKRKIEASLVVPDLVHGTSCTHDDSGKSQADDRTVPRDRQLPTQQCCAEAHSTCAQDCADGRGRPRRGRHGPDSWKVLLEVHKWTCSRGPRRTVGRGGPRRTVGRASRIWQFHLDFHLICSLIWTHPSAVCVPRQDNGPLSSASNRAGSTT